MSDRLITEPEAKAMMPWRCIKTGEVYFEGADGTRIFVPRETLIHIYQRHSEVVAGLAAKR